MNIRPFLKRLHLKQIFFAVFLCFVLFVGYIYVVKQPSNTRDWEYGFEILPTFAFDGDTVAISKMRDMEYTGGKDFTKHYIDRTFDTSKISNVWFLVSKFWGYEGIAHTLFIFDMQDGEPVTVSVEARREKGEAYEFLGGVMNKFELMYVWGSERDSLLRRTLVNKDQVYMYNLAVSDSSRKKLFERLAMRSQALNEQPRFYNTLFSNCTNELAKSANEVKPGAIPLNISLVLPGYSVRELVKRGYIKSSGDFEMFEKKHYINDFITEHYNDADFSTKLRSFVSSQ